MDDFRDEGVTDPYEFAEHYIAWLASKGKTLQDKFDEYLYNNYPIGNGDMLVELYEDTDILCDWLKDMGLPEDLEVLP
jgi:hypothetical protein